MTSNEILSQQGDEMTRDEAINLANAFIALEFGEFAFTFEECCHKTELPIRSKHDTWDWFVLYEDNPPLVDIDCSPMVVFVQESPRKVWYHERI
jgi:hypothetical protein